MGKNTFGKTMPRALSQNLKIMGEQIMLARERRHLSMQISTIRWDEIKQRERGLFPNVKITQRNYQLCCFMT